MNHSFNIVLDRLNSNSVKWDETEAIFGVKDVLPMWIADLDFKTPEAVIQALHKKVEHGVFGYSSVSNKTRNIFQNWVLKRHNWNILQEWITFSNGIVPAISTAIQAFTNLGDQVAILSPVYNPFFEMIEKNGRTVVHSELQLIDDTYYINFEDIAAKLENVKLLLLCNPHNPSGRVWKKDELLKLGNICVEKGILVLSDEIHSDLILPGHKHIPFASLNDDFAQASITCMAPSKTFNIAGLQASTIVIPNEQHRIKFIEFQQKQGFNALNTFGIIGMESAYEHGEEWLAELLQYIKGNIDYTEQFLAEHLPNIHMIKPEASFLVWLNCRNLQLSDDEIKNRLLYKGKIALESGIKYGPGGEGFIRMNIGCPRETLKDGLNRLYEALK